ncbi:MAG: amidohydrolase family protein [Pseudomonadota bacterium]
MLATSDSSNFRRLALVGIAGTVVLIIVLLNLPLVAWTDRLADLEIGQLVLAHRKASALTALLLVALIGAWVLYERRWGLLRKLCAAAYIMMFVVAAYAFQRAYPRADVFSLSRIQDSGAILLGKDIRLSQYDPRSTLVLKRRAVERAAFPAIDIHFHLESLPPTVTAEQLVKAMDAAGVAKLVHLGGLETTFDAQARAFRDKYPDRFIFFAKPDPGALQRANGVAQQVEWLKRAARMGARGVKENKSYGLSQLDADGKVVAIDDPRMDPVWETAGKLGMPVLMHTAEPAGFFAPTDEHNERLLELLRYPGFSLYGPGTPSHKDLMDQRERLLAKHPGTNFIGAHFGMNPEDLAYVGYMLDKYPNYYVDMSSVVQELGRQPYSARRFFIRYQDRILFGTDGGFGNDPAGEWPAERMYRSYFEFLETDNEYFDYPMKSISKQGTWEIYGIDLPPEVLEKIYVRNAERLLPTDAAIEAGLAALAAPGN